MLPPHLCTPSFPYTTLFRSARQAEDLLRRGRRRRQDVRDAGGGTREACRRRRRRGGIRRASRPPRDRSAARDARSEEHTSELQSPCNLVCRLLLEKKKRNKT